MKQLIKQLFSLSLALVALAVFVVPAIASNVGEGGVSIGNPLDPNSPSGPVSLADPNRELDTVTFIQQRAGKLVATMMGLLAALSLIPVVIGGFQLIISQGGKYAEKGKQTLFWGVVGLVIGLSGYIIISAVLDIIIQAPPQ